MVLRSVELTISDLGCAVDIQRHGEGYGRVGANAYRAPEVSLGQCVMVQGAHFLTSLSMFRVAVDGGRG